MPRLSNAEPVFPADAGTLTRIFMERTSYRPDPAAAAKIKSDAKAALRVGAHVLAQLAHGVGFQVGPWFRLLVPLLVGFERESLPELGEDAAERLRDVRFQRLGTGERSGIEQLLQPARCELEQDVAVVGLVEPQMALVGPRRCAFKCGEVGQDGRAKIHFDLGLKTAL